LFGKAWKFRGKAWKFKNISQRSRNTCGGFNGILVGDSMELLVTLFGESQVLAVIVVLCSSLEKEQRIHHVKKRFRARKDDVTTRRRFLI
jgi:hypothetical protein